MNSTFKNRIPGLMRHSVLAMFSLAAFSAGDKLRADTASADAIQGGKKNVRIMHNEDGTYTEFHRSSDERVIERRTYGERPGGGGDRVLRMSIIYRKDIHGKLRSGIVYDGSGAKLYRIVYGYDKHTGKLVAEDMFDARVKRTKVATDPDTGKPYEKEMPVRWLRYRYDAQGRQLKPIVICLPAGKKAEELFGKSGSSYADPWANPNHTVNPNAKPTR